MKNIFCGFLVMIMFAINVNAQTAHKFLRSADENYEGADFVQAEEEYRKSLEKESSAQGRYNLGNAIYQQERFDEAIKQYNDALQSTDDQTIRKNAYHNLGNAHFSKEEYDKSIEAYKSALRLDPKSMETKKNLAQAMRLIQQQQEQQKQQQQDQENQEQNEEEQEQQEQQQQDQTQDQNEEQEQKDQQQQQEESEAEETPKEKDLNKEEARKLLQIMEDEEKEVQKKMKKGDGKRGKSAKDW